MTAVDWTKDFWTAGETDAEHAERVEAAKEYAGDLFAKATKHQSQHWRDTISVISAYKGAPRWDRLKADADAKFAETTTEAAALYERTCVHVMQTGDLWLSDELDAEWTALIQLNAVHSAMESAA